MSVEVLHRGFDGLKLTVQAQLPCELRAKLADAKAYSIESQGDVGLALNGKTFNLRHTGGSGYVLDTGQLGAIWLLRDFELGESTLPAITVDFRAFGLATKGLDGAETHFREVIKKFGITHADHQVQVTRVDFAVDFLAPWFAPDRSALVVPPGTKIAEYTGIDETETRTIGARVTGLRAGAVANRQLAIYDKRAEVLSTGKVGWVTIWDAERKMNKLPPLDLKDRDKSQVWRFEYRLGRKHLRNRFEIKSWQDLRDMIGDAYDDALAKLRYTTPTNDSNRSRWPKHRLWEQFELSIANRLIDCRSGVLPSDVVRANRTEKQREFDRQLLGLFVTRAAISDVTAQEFGGFVERHSKTLAKCSADHPVSLDDRLSKAAGRYQWE